MKSGNGGGGQKGPKRVDVLCERSLSEFGIQPRLESRATCTVYDHDIEGVFLLDGSE